MKRQFILNLIEKYSLANQNRQEQECYKRYYLYYLLYIVWKSVDSVSPGIICHRHQLKIADITVECVAIFECDNMLCWYFSMMITPDLVVIQYPLRIFHLVIKICLFSFVISLNNRSIRFPIVRPVSRFPHCVLALGINLFTHLLAFVYRCMTFGESCFLATFN